MACRWVCSRYNKIGYRRRYKWSKRNTNKPSYTAAECGQTFGRGAATGALDSFSPEVRKQLASDMGGAAGDAFGRSAVNGVTSEIHNKATSTVKSTAQAVCEHPYATAGLLSGLGILGATIHYVREAYPSREESHRRAKLERESVEHKQMADSLATETEFRTCLNKHFRCMEPGQRMPRQCHSPARRFSLLNATKLDEMLNALNKFKD